MRQRPEVESWPPPSSPDESEAKRELRLEEEREAKRVSDAIDLAISQEKEQRRKAPGAKILLLGQAESGKSTILKNFQLHFSPKAFNDQAELWRPIIHLNLVRSVNFILNILVPPRSGSTSPPPLAAQLDDTLRKLCFSLAPLKQVEEALTKRITGSSTVLPAVPDNYDYRKADIDPTHIKHYQWQPYHPTRAAEISVRSGHNSWKGLLTSKFKRHSYDSQDTSYNKFEDMQNRRIITACNEDIGALWRHPKVQAKLMEEEVYLRDQPGFFLEDVPRVTDENYMPTSSDILRARVRTIGPEEHRIFMENSAPENGGGREWVVYDVGGARSQRAAWAQFFDDAFNQALAEDRTVNRLADSMKLWRTICSNKLLANVDLILLLNKIDILDAHLKAGIQFSRYVTSYKGRPNEVEAVSRYLLDMFNGLHHQHSPKKRKIHPHLTCAVDTKATGVVIQHIQELILIKTLSETNIL
ncbi:putative g-protein alpha subunit [Moniliophthora roreri]|uniref:G-alpha-domain-containing protein n=1 Tax=Moniliophthora roreri TaxID=221103 RepID=A0A0W0EV06_MONRR|nr:putative g-protein alpha subunit [Moniliophthora roreri]